MHLIGKILIIIVLLILTVTRSVPLQPEDHPEYIILRSGTEITIDGRLDEPAWISAPNVGEFVFPWHKNGKKEQTVAKLLWDDTHLYIAFICEDAYIWAEHTMRRSRVYQDDTVEIFTAPNPDQPDAYYNIEMNVLGAMLDGYSPQGRGTAKREEWMAENVRIKTTIVGTLNDDSDEDEYWMLEAAIPFENFAPSGQRTPPEPGDVWRLNLNRLGGNTNVQHSQWSASRTERPSFHVPEDFGRVFFSDKTSPF